LQTVHYYNTWYNIRRRRRRRNFGSGKTNIIAKAIRIIPTSSRFTIHNNIITVHLVQSCTYIIYHIMMCTYNVYKRSQKTLHEPRTRAITFESKILRRISTHTRISNFLLLPLSSIKYSISLL